MTSVAAVLFDRDGTLVADVPYNGDPDRVRLLPGAAEAVALARSRGLATGVVSNQSGIGRGLLTAGQVRAVNARADALLGGVDTWVFCPHAPDAGCPCRKPRPGLIRTAAARLGVPAAACLVIGDIAADVLAARAAGARGVLVPNAATAPEEVKRFAKQTFPDVLTAVRRALATPAGSDVPAGPGSGGPAGSDASAGFGRPAEFDVPAAPGSGGVAGSDVPAGPGSGGPAGSDASAGFGRPGGPGSGGPVGFGGCGGRPSP